MRTTEADLTRWEPWKALAAIVAASAVFCGSVLGVSSYLTRSTPTVRTQLRNENPLAARCEV